MGTYRIVIADLRCERCGEAHASQIQFKTDLGDWQEEYEEGTQLSEDDDLKPGEFVRGNRRPLLFKMLLGIPHRRN